jgi:glycerophosphoryl diester phosphodiesterase
MENISGYADGIGPDMSLLIGPSSKPKSIKPSTLLQKAKENGLIVIPYTFRVEKEYIPYFAEDFNELLKIYLELLDVDGVFTDFPDKVVFFLNNSGL